MASPMGSNRGKPTWPPQECILYKTPQVSDWWCNNKGANQSARMHRLVCAFVVFKLRRQSFSSWGPSVLLLSLNIVDALWQLSQTGSTLDGVGGVGGGGGGGGGSRVRIWSFGRGVKAQAPKKTLLAPEIAFILLHYIIWNSPKRPDLKSCIYLSRILNRQRLTIHLKGFEFSMHILTIKYLWIYKYYDVILFSEKEKSTPILLKFLLFIICEYNLILYKYISFHDSMKNK